jgi:prepilin-type N-terminal cleavage/methylation domain-containing protein
VRVTRRRKPGFTLVEVLISLVILLVAFAGILSLLVASTRQAGAVVEDTFASTLARSVFEAVRVGVRERSFAIDRGDGVIARGFVLSHEGVGSPGDVPPQLLPNPGADQLPVLQGSDQVVFLPAASPESDGVGAPDPTFVYPRPGGTTDNAPVPYGLDNALPEADAAGIENQWGSVKLDVRRVYALPAAGFALVADGDAEGSPGDVTGDGAADETAVADARDQYSFALTVRRASAPPLVSPDGETPDWEAQGFTPAGLQRTDGLYQVRVLVFRNFTPERTARGHVPVVGGDFSGLVAVGP